MKELNIAKILVEKRRERGITQEELASYIGVSKASISKWETGQSYPDITFLPQLASYFNISIDLLIGYQPQMTKEDIKKLYQNLAEAFGKEPFDEVYNNCQEIVKKYYSCFPLLLQIAALYLNHYMLSDNNEQQEQMLQDATSLCKRIKSESMDIGLSKDAEFLEATICLYSGHPAEVLELLDENLRPISQETELIAQAYQMLGNTEYADYTLQVAIYQHLISMMGSTSQLLLLNTDSPKRIEEILSRSLAMADTYQLENLHPNTMAVLYLTAAQIYAAYQDSEHTLLYLNRYANLAKYFFPAVLHGDSYFNKIDSWIQDFALGNAAPRSEQLIRESLLKAVTDNPSFQSLKDMPEYKRILKQLESI